MGIRGDSVEVYIDELVLGTSELKDRSSFVSALERQLGAVLPQANVIAPSIVDAVVATAHRSSGRPKK